MQTEQFWKGYFMYLLPHIHVASQKMACANQLPINDTKLDPLVKLVPPTPLHCRGTFFPLRFIIAYPRLGKL